MKYYFLESYGDRNTYISVNEYFYLDKEKSRRVYQNRYNQYIYEPEPGDEEGSDPSVLFTDLYSDKSDKANWNNMFAAAQLDEQPEEQKQFGELLGCTGELIVNEKLRDILLSFCDKQSTECISIELTDTKVKLPGRYFLINPLLEIDVLNYQASNLIFFYDEMQSRIKKMFLDPVKLQKAPAVFRIKHKRYKIVISQLVLDELIKNKCSNLEVEEINQIARKNDLDDEKYKLNTALYSAVENNKYEIARSMIKRGGDIHYANQEGIAALELLKENNQEELIMLFNEMKN
jgi:hypothetical protein